MWKFLRCPSIIYSLPNWAQRSKGNPKTPLLDPMSYSGGDCAGSMLRIARKSSNCTRLPKVIDIEIILSVLAPFLWAESTNPFSLSYKYLLGSHVRMYVSKFM